jgi:hypothetical protein
MQFVQLLQQPVARFTRLAHFAPLSPKIFEFNAALKRWNVIRQIVVQLKCAESLVKVRNNSAVSEKFETGSRAMTFSASKPNHQRVEYRLRIIRSSNI